MTPLRTFPRRSALVVLPMQHILSTGAVQQVLPAFLASGLA
jgi:hypothetical protein